jgi:hypothetical protein
MHSSLSVTTYYLSRLNSVFIHLGKPCTDSTACFNVHVLLTSAAVWEQGGSLLCSVLSSITGILNYYSATSGGGGVEERAPARAAGACARDGRDSE